MSMQFAGGAVRGFKSHKSELEDEVSLVANSKRVRSVFVIGLCSCLFVFLSLVAIGECRRQSAERLRMADLALIKSSKINETIISLLYKAESLMTLVIQSDGEVKNFERIAKQLVDHPSIRNVLLAPGGIVKYAYPLKTNEKLIGFDMFSDMPGNLEARQARDTGRLTLGGPFQSVQSGEIIVGRLPVYINDTTGTRTLWGLVSVTLDYPAVLKDVNLDDMTLAGYVCEIWRENPDTVTRQIILSSTGEERKNMAVEHSFSIMNANWNIGIAPITPWFARADLYKSLLISLLLSLLLASLSRDYERMKQMKKTLEMLAMNDSLTQLANRRCLMLEFQQQIKRCKAAKTTFAVMGFDIRRFKQINDIYGHAAGDAVLVEIGKRLSKFAGKNNLVARISGDEFMIILRDIDGIDLLGKQDAAEKEITQPIAVTDYNKIEVSVCSGVAVYPADGHTVENLMLFVEHSIYSEKYKEEISKREML